MTDRDLLQQMIARIGKEPRAVEFDDDHLTELNLAGLDLEEIPHEIYAFALLRSLRLGESMREPRRVTVIGNRIRRLDPAIRLWLALEELCLDGNQITTLPDDLFGLNRLKLLSVCGNQVDFLPPRLGQLSHLQALDLSSNHLTSLPAEVGQLANLEILDLYDNDLTTLPPELGQLANLQTLRLSDNKLTCLPPELGQLGQLKVLRLHRNKLSDLPPELNRLSMLEDLTLCDNSLGKSNLEFGGLLRLRALNLGGNHLSRVPESVNTLSNLEILWLWDNQLTSLRLNYANFSKLDGLDLRDNQLQVVPSEIGQLTSLTMLLLSGNHLTSLPSEIGLLTQLEQLWLDDNRLVSLPRSVISLTRLKDLRLDGNPLRTPPPEIAAHGAAGVRAYLARLDDTSVVRHEAKLLLVGEGGTGKSSLLRALRGLDFDANLSTTHGIDVLPITLYCPNRDCVDLTLNVWDFGGQQIYHTTHQFFMTRRSFYLLVWNARGDVDQSRLDHWLRKIQMLAPGSPVLLIATHSDERLANINLDRFRAAYPQIVGLATVSNKTGTGIEALKAVLTAEAAKLPLMEQEWPRAWVEVEEALLAADKTHISGEEFAAICASCGVDDAFEQGVLGGYLHDLGKILYYQDDDVLCDFVVLKPNWLTGAMARVLDDVVTRDERRGVLDHADFPRIWHGYDRRLYPVFTRMLERFLVSYQLEEPAPGRRQSMVPLLLPHSPPVGLPPWPEVLPDLPEVRMVFDLDFVPDGIMSWFIVLTHHFSQDLHWREGVRLQYEGHQAHVELNPSTRQLWLHVRGPAPSNFFNILQHTINDRIIRRYFEGLTYRRRVPCICHKALGEAAPCTRYFDYDKLVERKQRGRPTVECDRTYADVSVTELLEGIHYTTLDQLGEKVDHILEIVGENRDLLMQIQQLSEQFMREQARMWNLLTKSLFSEAPSVFLVMPGDRRSYDPRGLFSEDYDLYLLCQHPASPHMVAGEKGYPAPKDREWWRQVRPWLRQLAKILKFVPKLSGVAKVYDEQADRLLQISAEIQGTAFDIPSNFAAPTDLAARRELGVTLGMDVEAEGVALRALHTFLHEVDKTQHWCGLQKVVTNDGNILWLCAEHARFHGI